MHGLVTYLNWTLIFESYVVWYGSKNGYQKYMIFFQGDWTTSSNYTTISYSLVNKTGEPIWPFHKHENLHLDNGYDIQTSSKDYEGSGYNFDHLDF